MTNHVTILEVLKKVNKQIFRVYHWSYVSLGAEKTK